MFERDVSVAEVRAIIETGETIESRPDDLPTPSRLILGSAGGRALHVVVAEDVESDTAIVVTVYEPDPAMWHPGYRRRRKQ